MILKKIFQQLNIAYQCRRYGLSLWQCPQFLLLIMGIVIIAASLLTYFIGTLFIDEPAVIALIVLTLAAILMIIAAAIISGFERLAEANRMKSEFISVVSHQLRSPLSNLKWAIELLMSGRLGKLEENQIEYFKILKENSDRMKELVNDLLIVSRIEQKTLSFVKKEFSLKDLVKELVLDFKPFIEASNVETKIEAPENLPNVFGDRAQIRLAVENLLDNAIRYVKPVGSPGGKEPEEGLRGRGKIEIKLEKRGKNFYFEISDNGVGIPKEDQKYIFQKFFRSENALRYQTQGSGLGLYIAKAIIEKPGGKIGFESEEGKGSMFWFTLPIK